MAELYRYVYGTVGQEAPVSLVSKAIQMRSPCRLWRGPQILLLFMSVLNAVGRNDALAKSAGQLASGLGWMSGREIYG